MNETLALEREFVKDFNKYTKKELMKRFDLTNLKYDELRKKYKLNKSRKRILGKKINSFEQECNICVWWLTGDEVHQIARLYGCATDEIEAALKNVKAMAIAQREVLHYRGVQAIKRKLKDIERIYT